MRRMSRKSFPPGFNCYFRRVFDISGCTTRRFTLIWFNNNVTRWRNFAYDNAFRDSFVSSRSFRYCVRSRSKRERFSRSYSSSLAYASAQRALAALSRARKFALYHSQTWITHPAFQLQPITWIEWRRVCSRDEAKKVVIVRVDIAARAKFLARPR